MPEHASVHIVVVNWNGGDVTDDCLRSLAAVTAPEHCVIVVDNASTDGSGERIRSDHAGVVLLQQERNLRFAGGNNAGIRYALAHGATSVLLLNNDTTVDPGFLAALVRRLEREPGAGMVAPKIYYHSDPRRIWFAGGILSWWTGTMRHRGIREIDQGQYDMPCPVDYASGCCLLVKREVVERIGMLDESFYMYTEDADWCMRARRAGYTIWYEPQAMIWHKLSVSAGGHLSWFKMKHKFLSNLRFFGRYAAWYHWPFFPWANLVVNAWAAVRYLVRAR